MEPLLPHAMAQTQCETRYDCGNEGEVDVDHRGQTYTVCFGCYVNKLSDWEKEA